MEKIKINNLEYEIIKNYRDAIDEEELTSKLTDYFTSFDYILGDWAYSKLRLKGFYDRKHKDVNKINNIDNKDDYLKKNCAFDCKYFIIKKI